MGLGSKRDFRGRTTRKSWIGSELIAQFNFQEHCSLDHQVNEIERWPAA